MNFMLINDISPTVDVILTIMEFDISCKWHHLSREAYFSECMLVAAYYMYCTYQVTVFECRVNHMFLYWSQAQFCLHTCWMFGVKLHFQTFVWIGNWKDQTFSLKDHYQGQLSLDFHAIAFLVRKKDLEMVFR